MTNADLRNYLTNTNIFQFLEPKELDMLISNSQIVSFSAGEIIIQQGKTNDFLYIIIEGTAIISAKTLGEGVAQIETLDRGKFLGEVSFIFKGPSPTSIFASDKMQCLLITRTYFDLLTLYYQSTKFKIITAIANQGCSRVKRIHSKIINFIATTDMTTRSLVGEVIKSLSSSTVLNPEDAVDQLDLLRKSLLLEAFKLSEIEELFKHVAFLRAPKNFTLIEENAKDMSCYIVLSGGAQSSIIHNNKVAKLSVIGPLLLFCGLSCFDTSSPAMVHFSTCEHAILLKISESNQQELKNNNIELWYKLFDLMCNSLVALERSMDKLDIRLNIETYNR